MSKKGLDKNSIIGLVLISAILLVFSYITRPTEEELKAAELAKKNKIENVEKENVSTNNEILNETSPEVLTIDSIPSNENDSLENIALFAQYGPFKNSLNGENKYFILENENVEIKISNKGGRVCAVRLKNFHTYDSLPLNLFNEDSSRFNLELTIPGITGGNSIRQINTEELFFQTDEKGFSDNNDNQQSISLKLYGNTKNEYIEYLYTLKGNSYVLDFNINSVGFDKVLSPHSNYYLNWSMYTPNQEKTIANQKNISTIYYQYNNTEMDYINPMKYEEQPLDASIDWVMLKQQYFNSTILATEKPFLKIDSKIITTELPEGQTSNYVQGMGTDLTVPFEGGSNESFKMQFYFGPNKYELLKDVGFGIENSIDFGWPIIKHVNKYIIRNVFLFFNSFDLQIGLVILLLTFTIKLLLFPITWKTYLSSAKMRVLKPEIDALKEKISDKMKLQQATMSLYRQTGVNPLAGCIPMLIQMPILFALFRFFPATFDMRQKSFLWAEDLSTYDSIYDLPFNIPMYGDHISLFTLLMAISMIFYTKANSQMTAGAMDGPMASQMKIMTYLMPVMMLFFFNSYAAGLSFYYLIANVITIAQQYIIRKWIVDEEKILAKIQSNKTKPKKKSGFAAKLEAKMKEAQKLQEQRKKK